MGFRSLGIGPGGAMDYFAMKSSNFLVGNDREAVLEFGYSSSEILFDDDSVISITGRGFETSVNDEIAPMWKPFRITKNSVLTLKKKSSGVWAYLATRGGWEAQEWLTSFTTNISANAGGFDGRMLRKDDVVEMNEEKTASIDAGALTWGISRNELSEVYSTANMIRCISSAETDLMSLASREEFESTEFVVSSQSNRMGYRMKGKALSLSEKIELISSPVDSGTVQLLPDGNLIVLMADHQTTGGYPRIASVVKVDLPKFSQLMPGERVNFKMISFQEAEAALNSRHQKLDELRKSCHIRIENTFSDDH